MKKAIALLLALVTLLSLTACAGKEDAASSALDQIKQKGELVVGTSADYPPYEFHAEVDGKDTIVGFDMEIAQAIADKLKRENNLEYDPSQITVGAGAKHACFNAIMATVSEGDEVIIPSPYWVSYPEMVRMCGGIPVIVETTPENGWKLTAEQFEEAMTPRTKMVILTTPNNPTGAVYSEEELRALGEVALSEDILILADEIYEHLVYGDTRHVSIASLSPELYLSLIHI